MKILVVEDDKDLMEIITKSLEKERYVVSQAPDYRTALMKAGDYDYDCILLDIMLRRTVMVWTCWPNSRIWERRQML